MTFAEAEPEDAFPLLRAGEIDLALAFASRRCRRPTRAISPRCRSCTTRRSLVVPAGHKRRPATAPVQLEAVAGETWIAGCERCRAHLMHRRARGGFAPEIEFATDDYMTVQSLIARTSACRCFPGSPCAPVAGPTWPSCRSPDSPGAPSRRAARSRAAATGGDGDARRAARRGRRPLRRSGRSAARPAPCAVSDPANVPSADARFAARLPPCLVTEGTSDWTARAGSSARREQCRAAAARLTAGGRRSSRRSLRAQRGARLRDGCRRLA